MSVFDVVDQQIAARNTERAQRTGNVFSGADAIAFGLDEDTQRKATPLERVLDVLGTSNFAIAGASRAMLEGRNPLEGIGEGIQNKTTFGDILREQGAPGPVSFFGGLALDIGLDPLTYVGIGGLTKTGQLARSARIGLEVARQSGDAAKIAEATRAVAETGRFSSRVKKQAEAGQRALISFAGQPVIRGGPVLEAAARLGGATKPLVAGLRVAPELSGVKRETFLARSAQQRAARRTAIKQANEAFNPIRKEIGGIASAHGIKHADLVRSLTTAAELAKSDIGGVAGSIEKATRIFGTDAQAALTQPFKEAIAAINGMNAAAVASTRREGIKVAELTDDVVDYVARRGTPEAQREIVKFGNIDLSGTMPARRKAQIQRDFRGKTTAEVNDLWQAGKLELNGFRPTRSLLFEEDPFISTTIRSAEAANEIASARFLKDWARAYGKPAAEAPRGWASVPSNLVDLKNIRFEPKMARTLRQHFAAVRAPNRFISEFDNLQRIWKKWTLGIFPIYHTRNELGDLWNASVLGGMNIARIKDGIRVVSTGGENATIKIGERLVKGSELTELAQRLGVIDVGLVGEIETELGALRRGHGVIRNVMQHLDDNKATRLGMMVGTWRENATRMSFFIDRLAKGDIPEAAALEVKKHLFDYAELTDFERNVLRRVFPFYSWTRYNTPLQLQYLFKKPGAAAAIQKAREEAAGDQPLGLETGQLPPFLRESIPVRAGESPEGLPRFTRLEGQLPLADVNVALSPSAAVSRVASLLSPFIAAPLEAAANVDLFRSNITAGEFKKREEFPGETKQFLGVPIPKRFSQFPESIRLLSEINRQMGGDQTALERLVNVTLGKTYTIDELEQALREEARIKSEIRRLKGRLNKALADGDESNARLLERRISALEGTSLEP